MTFAGPEIDRVEVIALGNRPAPAATWSRGYSRSRPTRCSGSAPLTSHCGCRPVAFRHPADVPLFLLKVGIAADSKIRGARTLVYSSALAPASHLRAAASA